MKKRRFAVLPILAALVPASLFISCSENATDPEDNDPVETLTLAGQPWKLVAVEEDGGGEQPLAPYELYSATFGENTFEGYLGCNEISANYQLAGDDGLTFSDISATGEGCDVHEHSAQYMAGLESVGVMELQGETLRLKSDDGSQILRFAPATFQEKLPIDFDGDGTADVEIRFVSERSDDLVTGISLDYYEVRAREDALLLGGSGDSGIFGAPLLRGMTINTQPIPPFEWVESLRLAEREWTLTRPGFWGGPWAEGTSYYLGVALLREGEPFFGWVQIKLRTAEPVFNMHVLDFYFKKQPVITSRAGEH